MSIEPWQWVLAALAAILTGLSKTGISGLGIFAVVIFASILPARESVGVVLAILLAGDVVAITVYRREAHWGHLIRLFPWAAVGIVVGAVTAGRTPDKRCDLRWVCRVSPDQRPAQKQNATGAAMLPGRVGRAS